MPSHLPPSPYQISAGVRPGGRTTPVARGPPRSDQRGAPQLPLPVWVGADALKVLAGPALSSLTYAPQQEHEAQSNLKDDPVAAHERAAVAQLRRQRPVAALAELEAALCLCEKRGLEDDSSIRRRWTELAASAIAWSFDFLAEVGIGGRTPGDGSGGTNALDQALEMLCLAEVLTRKEVAETFSAAALHVRPFLRALAQAGLGGYYYIRQKPRVALRFLQQAASGQARWVHPAVLLNISAAFTLMKQPEEALGALNEAILALRSAIGRLCGESMEEVTAAAQAATTAVNAVLGPPNGEMDVEFEEPLPPSQERARTGTFSEPAAGPGPGTFSRQTSIEARRPSTFDVEPMDGGEDLGDYMEQRRPSISSQGARTHSSRPPSAPIPPPPTRKLRLAERGPHGGRSATPSVQLGNVEIAVTHTLLAAKVLLWPWPEFREIGAPGTPEEGNPTPLQVAAGEDRLPPSLREFVAPGIARHAANLKKVWTAWARPVPAQDAPGAGLVLRECLLLCFLHGAASLAHCCPERRWETWVLPLLREGLALAIVLFGPKHPLAVKLINSFQKLQRTPAGPVPFYLPGAGSLPPTPTQRAGGYACFQRGGTQPLGCGSVDSIQGGGRGRPPSAPSAVGRGRKPAKVLPQPGAPKATKMMMGGSSPAVGVRKGALPVHDFFNAEVSRPGSPADARRSPSPAQGFRRSGYRNIVPVLQRDLSGGSSRGPEKAWRASPAAMGGRGRPPQLHAPRSRSSSVSSMDRYEIGRAATPQAALRQLRPSSAVLSGGGLGRRIKARLLGCGGRVNSPAACSAPSTPRKDILGAPYGEHGRRREPVLSSVRNKLPGRYTPTPEGSGFPPPQPVAVPKR